MNANNGLKLSNYLLLLIAITTMCGCRKADIGVSPVRSNSFVSIGSFCSVSSEGFTLRRSAENELHLKKDDDDIYIHELTNSERRNLRAFILSRLRISKHQGFHANLDFVRAITSSASNDHFSPSTVVLSNGSSKQVLLWFGDVHWVEIHVLGGTTSTVEHLKKLKEGLRKTVLCSSA